MRKDKCMIVYTMTLQDGAPRTLIAHELLDTRINMKEEDVDKKIQCKLKVVKVLINKTANSDEGLTSIFQGWHNKRRLLRSKAEVVKNIFDPKQIILEY